MRFWLACTALALVAAPGAVRADLAADDIAIELKIPKESASPDSTIADDFTAAADNDQLRYLNQAHCICDTSGETQNLQLTYTWNNDPRPLTNTQVAVMTGTSCDSTDASIVMNSCLDLNMSFDPNDIDPTYRTYIRVGDFVSPDVPTSPGVCDESLPQGTTWTGVLASGIYGATSKLEATLDLRAPPLPTLTSVTPSEDSIVLEWDRITTNSEDVAYFQALCAVDDDNSAGTPALSEASHSARYDTVHSVCQLTYEETLEEAAGFGDTPILTELPTGLKDLDEAFLCGQETGSATSMRIRNLTNGTPYRVVLLTVDNAGNFSGLYTSGSFTPVPVTDFWEDLNDENPDLEGGLCLVESVYGGGGGGGGGLLGALRGFRDQTLARTALGRWLIERYYAWGAPLAATARDSVVARVVLAVVLAPLVVVALAWHALTLPGLLGLCALLIVWRRRRRRPAAPATRPRRTGWRLAVTAGLVALAVPSLAAAQGSTAPYWDDELDDTVVGPAVPHWHLGVRLGPYTPSIDDGFTSSPGPFERMYGGGGLLPTVDVHYLFSLAVGQVGFGVSAGIFGKTADAYEPGGTTGDPNRPRATDSSTAFRVVPLELTGIFRASLFDDRWSVPVVPYVRGGLGYYVWWIRAPSGDLADAMTCDATGSNCTGDKGMGASLGLVGAVGLAIRAERIDASAVRSMRDTGIEHAGFYAELSTAWVDGFGSDKKLSLGDTTWSAGIDFEF